MFILQNVFRVNTLYIGYSNKKIAFFPIYTQPHGNRVKNVGEIYVEVKANTEQ